MNRFLVLMSLSLALLAAHPSRSEASPQGGAALRDNVTILNDYVNAVLYSSYGGALPTYYYDCDPLVMDLLAGLPGLTGLNPSGEEWCAAYFWVWRDCSPPWSSVEAYPWVTGPINDPDCLAASITIPKHAAMSAASSELVQGSMSAYIVFFHPTYAALPVPIRISELFNSYWNNLPTVHCNGGSNSTGNAASLWSSGVSSVALNDFGLHVGSAPPGQVGLFVYGAPSTPTPFGDGTLCVGGSGGVFRLPPAGVVDPTGTVTRYLDLVGGPAGSGPGQILPGSTWGFQFWYRDPAANGAGFNLSDGLSLDFCN